MNPVFHTPSPELETANLPEPPRKKSVPPPLPRWDSVSPASSGFPRCASGAGDSLHPLILSPTPIDTHEPHHRWITSAKLISIGVVALLVTSMLIRSHQGSGEPSTLQPGVLVSKPPVIIPRQVVELDEVLIEGALYDKEPVERNAAFDPASVEESSDE